MFALTIPQQNIWNLQSYYSQTSIANVCGSFLFDGKCDHGLLSAAVNKVIALQAGLRLRIKEADGRPMQYEAPYQSEQFAIMSFDDVNAFEVYAQRYAKEHFDIYDTALYHFVIVQVGDRSRVLMCASHLIVDAWAVSLISNMIASCYGALAEGEDIEEISYSYTSFAESEKQYLQSQRYEKDKAYWSSQYQIEPSLSSVKPHSSAAIHPSSKRLAVQVPAALSSKIRQFSESSGVTPAVLFESALVAYINRINEDSNRVTVGMLVLNRGSAKEKSTVGDFISTIPATYDLSNVHTAMELFQAIQENHMQLFRHQRYPYAQILRDLRERYSFSGNLYDVLFSFQNAQTGVNGTTKWYSNGNCEVPLEFHVDDRDNQGAYTINLDYQVEVFTQEEEVDLLVRRILYILNQILNQPSGSLKKVKLLPEEELQKVIFDFNQTDRPFQRDMCVHELFAAKAREYPDKAAVIFEGQKLTFRQLDEMSNSLAHALRSKGVGRGMIVPIVSRHSWHFIVAMLGILKAGAAYMHVDISYPSERVQYMLSMSRSKLCLTHGVDKLEGTESINLDAFNYEAHRDPVCNESCPEDLCYLIFTSGSTGQPKGLMIAHRNAVNFAAYNDLNVFGKIIPDESWPILAISSTSFDMSVTETLLPLIDGITICLANDEEVLSQSKLSRLCSANGVKILETTPTKMRLYIADPTDVQYLQGIQAIILGGEALPADLYDELRKLTPAKIFNNYGPAETTVWSTIKEMTDEEITIGKPIANTQIYILGSDNEPMPIGVPGELCISGDGVGLGYINREDLTKERYVPNPFLAGKTMYHTGDLAQWRTDGELIHLGRIDSQVKIRGLRIELGEIESAMNGFPGIGSTAVADQKDDVGRQYLVGYYTGSLSLDERELRLYLSKRLPKYMVPNYFMRLESIPMTSSGKTDRKKLPRPQISHTNREYVPPESENEQTLCDILSALLSAEQVSVTDNLFEIGGDSLLAIQYVSQAHFHGVDITMQNVYDYPTVRSLCAYLDSAKSRKVTYEDKSFDRYTALLAHNEVEADFIPEFHSLGNVLLTGATGFLGAHVLEKLLKMDTGKVYCLVRNGYEQLKESLNYYFDDEFLPLFGTRIIPVKGDLTNEHLLHTLPCDVQTVIHTAASVKHYGSYQYFHEINTLGTKRVVEYASKINAKLLHISTISVSGNSLVDSFDLSSVDHQMEYKETDLYIGQPLENVYVHSKFEAELCVFDAMLKGLDGKIIRVGNLTNRTTDFRFQRNYASNAYLKRIKSILELGYMPDYILPLYAEFSPVDQTAEGIVRIGQYAKRQTVFHLNSSKPLYLRKMISILDELGIVIKVVSGEEFKKILQKTMSDAKTEYIYQALQNDLDGDGKLNYDNNIHVSNQFTAWFMKKVGFEWLEIDRKYLEGYINYFKSIGFFILP